MLCNTLLPHAAMAERAAVAEVVVPEAAAAGMRRPGLWWLCCCSVPACGALHWGVSAFALGSMVQLVHLCEGLQGVLLAFLPVARAPSAQGQNALPHQTLDP